MLATVRVRDQKYAARGCVTAGAWAFVGDSLTSEGTHVAPCNSHLEDLVNNAMVSVSSPVPQMTPAEYQRVSGVNYLGYVHGTLAALRHMRHMQPRDPGVITLFLARWR
jgi:NAD(P)-dependent dehydrogenase (short-subunit alcohol dehydrogenase family)